MWRRLILVTAAACLTLGNSGCFLNIWSADLNTRMEQMLFASEDLRQIEGIWRRFWFNDMPSHMTPERMDGGIMK